MDTLTTFLSSSWFAEESAAPTVARLLAHPCDDEERRLIESYADEEAEHARLLEAFFARRGLQRGAPFWIQPLIDLPRGRTALMVQIFHMELMAGHFYGAVAAHVEDAEARGLIRRLLRDEARHIKLFRELCARQLSRLGAVERVGVALAVNALHIAAWLTAHYQARQLRPVLGAAANTLPGKLWWRFRTELALLFRPAEDERALGWWWTPAVASPAPPSAAR